MGGCEFFPSTSIFHTRVDTLPVDISPAAPIPQQFRSAQVHPFFGSGGPSGGALPNGIPWLRVPYGLVNESVTTTLYQHDFTECPDPSYTPIEGSANAGFGAQGGDRHALVLQEAGHMQTCRLYEMWQGRRNQPGSKTNWTDSSNAAWPDLQSNELRYKIITLLSIACCVAIADVMMIHDGTGDSSQS